MRNLKSVKKIRSLFPIKTLGYLSQLPYKNKDEMRLQTDEKKMQPHRKKKRK